MLSLRQDGSLEIPIGESLAAENDISRWENAGIPVLPDEILSAAIISQCQSMQYWPLILDQYDLVRSWLTELYQNEERNSENGLRGANPLIVCDVTAPDLRDKVTKAVENGKALLVYIDNAKSIHTLPGVLSSLRTLQSLTFADISSFLDLFSFSHSS